jgi:hypothetical protein
MDHIPVGEIASQLPMFIDPTMILDNVLAGYWDAADAVGNSPYVADPEGLWERKRDGAAHGRRRAPATDATAGAMRSIRQPRQTTIPIAVQPGVHGLARHPVALRHLHYRYSGRQHFHHRVIPLVHNARVSVMFSATDSLVSRIARARSQHRPRRLLRHQLDLCPRRTRASELECLVRPAHRRRHSAAR